jgi:uncharacterized protein YdbL (DUF1318 family)
MTKRTARIAMVAIGTIMAAPMALALTADTASATGYAILYRADGSSGCDQGTNSECNTTLQP